MNEPTLTDTERLTVIDALEPFADGLPFDEQECFDEVIRPHVERFVAARVADAVDRERAAWVAKVSLCSQCGERPSAMVKIGTDDGWCTTCLDEAADSAWATKIETLAAEWEREAPPRSLNQIDAGIRSATLHDAHTLRGLLAADDTEGPTYREVVESLDPFYTSWGGRSADDTEGKP